jgi:density-regulated protein DRP1
LKKATVYDTKIIIARIQRQKRKYVTVVGGLESVPDLKIKDAAKVFGKKFSSGASINETQTGEKEVVIQGDLSFDLPPLLISEFKVSHGAL